METSRQPTEHPPPPPPPPALAYPSQHPHLSGRNSPFLHHLPHQMTAHPQQAPPNGTGLTTYAAPNGHPPHIRTHSANAAFTLGAGMATSPITPSVSSERGRGDDWSAPEPARGGDPTGTDGHHAHDGTGAGDGADDHSQQAVAAAGAPPAPDLASGQLADGGPADASAANGSLQVAPAWAANASAQGSRQSSCVP